ncbi:MAG: M6 family metalloprotease domain-containing protein [Paludibacteraceae bacterium]|nr:M6 family metalloprotease domain-containing protein [Paludibacteraceae bacterium]
MKKLSILLFCAILSICAFAVPARPGARTYKQPDGSSIQIYVHGDEFHHFTTDAEGNLLTCDDNGFYVKSTQQLSQKKKAAQRRQEINRRRAERRKASLAADKTKGLVILVNFSDKTFKTENTRDAFDEMLNGESYTYGGATGSVRQYYSDQSSGAFQPELVVYGPVTLSKSYSYYGSNDSEGNDKYCCTMVAEACNLAFEQYNIDLAYFDSDNDGYVDFVDILYAGYGEADSSDKNTIWPCEWALSDPYGDYRKVLTLGGKKIDTFSCHQELDGQTRKRAGIGTACHELGHVFGLPDFYDYENPTIGEWDIMDGGAYLNNGNTPPAFSGYERMCSGWAKPEMLNEAKKGVELDELQTSQQIYIITESGTHNFSGTNPNPKNFYILENRQNIGWDKYLPGHGMLIWRVQYNQSYWDYNIPNGVDWNSAGTKITKYHQGMNIMAADGKVKYEIDEDGTYFTYGDSGDPFPGTEGVTEYKNLPANWQITDIKEASQVISFNFSDKSGTGQVDPPTGNLTYERVTSAPADWSGNYLIVYEDGAKILDGSLETIDAAGNTQNVTISGNKISASSSYSFTIAKLNDGYSIRSASGLYIGHSGENNALKTNAETPFANTIEVGDDGVNIICNNFYLRYNATTGQERFRYFKESTYTKQGAIQLYRNDGSGTAVDNTANTEVTVVATDRLAVSGLNQNAQVSVYNIAGQMLYNTHVATDNIDIDLNAGIYLVRIANGTETITRKVIIR